MTKGFTTSLQAAVHPGALAAGALHTTKVNLQLPKLFIFFPQMVTRSQCGPQCNLTHVSPLG
jgi:hypothetical protein